MHSVKDDAKQGLKSLKRIFAKEGWELPNVDLTNKQEAVEYLKKQAEPLHAEWNRENARHNFNRVFNKSLWTGEPIKFAYSDWQPTKQPNEQLARDLGNQSYLLAKEIVEGKPYRVYLAGSPGTGKTSLALAMVDHIRNNSNKTAMFVSTDALAELYSTSYDDKQARDRLHELLAYMKGDKKLRINPVDVLILDDFGTEGGMRTDKQSQVRVDMQKGLFAVADARYGKQATIVTTNNKMSELESMYNEKLLSRLITRNPKHRLVFNGMQDMRASMF